MQRTDIRNTFESGKLLLLALLIALPAPMVTAGDTIEGFLEPYRSVRLASPETGIVTSVLVEEGDAVEKGDLLATLDDEIFVAGLAIARHEAQATAQLTTAQAQLKMRERRLQKLTELLKLGHAQPEEVVAAQTDVAVAKGSVLSAQEYLGLKRLECKRIEAQLARRKIVAPLDGRITAIHRREGEVVSAVDPNILTLTKLDFLTATFLLNVEQSRRLQKNQTVRVSVAAQRQPVQGCVEYVAAIADAKSGTVEVRVRIPNAAGTLLSGERCAMELP